MVIAADPVSPRQLNAAIPRDLETICLKCLQKSPAHRYASAADLADDLGRYLRHEPILARPAGPFERLWKWTKRNPSRAAFTAAMILLLVTIAGASTLLAIKERKSAKDQADYNTNLLREQGEKDLALRNQRIGSARLALDRGVILCEQGGHCSWPGRDERRPPPGYRSGSARRRVGHSLQPRGMGARDVALEDSVSGPAGCFCCGRAHPAEAEHRCTGNVEQDGRATEPGRAASAERKPIALDSMRCNSVSPPMGAGCSRERSRRSGFGMERPEKPLVQPLRGSLTLAAAMSLDGGTIATADANSVVRLWNVRSPQPGMRELRQAKPATLIQFRPDGSQLLTSEHDSLRRWNVETGAPLGIP